jgi:hypothetical protein
MAPAGLGSCRVFILFLGSLLHETDDYEMDLDDRSRLAQRAADGRPAGVRQSLSKYHKQDFSRVFPSVTDEPSFIECRISA